jgi:hypothetical protein
MFSDGPILVILDDTTLAQSHLTTSKNFEVGLPTLPGSRSRGPKAIQR